MAKKRTARKAKPARDSKPTRKSKLTSKSKTTARKKVAPTRSRKPAARRRAPRNTQPMEKSTAQIRQGVGLAEGGQSGDLQGLSGVVDVDSESVRELAEEGQDYEAGIIDGVENAPDPDVSEVKTREVNEDDVPEEYRNQ